MLQLQTMPANQFEQYSVYHKCTASYDDKIEPISIKCEKAGHVYCGICKHCNNEFHLMQQKYVSSFGVS